MSLNFTITAPRHPASASAEYEPIAAFSVRRTQHFSAAGLRATAHFPGVGQRQAPLSSQDWLAGGCYSSLLEAVGSRRVEVLPMALYGRWPRSAIWHASGLRVWNRRARRTVEYSLSLSLFLLFADN